MRFWVTYSGSGTFIGDPAQPLRLEANDDNYTLEELVGLLSEFKKSDAEDFGESGNEYYIWDSDEAAFYDAEEFRNVMRMIELHRTEVTTNYCRETDITFITEYVHDTNGYIVSVEVVGFYFGEPDEARTKANYRNLKARLS